MNKILRIFTLTLVGLASTLLFHVSQADDAGTVSPNSAQAESIPAIIKTIDVGLTAAEETARNSAVQVVTPSFSGYGSGTYFKIGERHIVLTAAHVVDDRNHMVILGRGEVKVSRVIYANHRTDIAFIELPAPMVSRIPTVLNGNFSPEIGTHVTYTGFPNNSDLITITGRIAGEQGRYKIMQGYAWMGASGSGVFDQRGRIIGIVSMVEVGDYMVPQIIEDIVWISPLDESDTIAIQRLLRGEDQPKKE